MRAAVVVAVFIGIMAFLAVAVLGVVAPAGTGTDWVVSAIAGVVMGLVAYFIIIEASQRKRILSSVLFGLILVAVLILGFQSQVWAALATGLIGAVITYLIYPIVTGKRSLPVKLGVVALAALILILAFAVLDPVVYLNPASVSIPHVKNADGSV